jgi:hypothetical protein
MSFFINRKMYLGDEAELPFKPISPAFHCKPSSL